MMKKKYIPPKVESITFPDVISTSTGETIVGGDLPTG